MEVRKVSISEVEELSQLAGQAYFDHYSHIRSPKGLQAYIEKTFSSTKLKRDFEKEDTFFFMIYEEQKALGYMKLKLDQAIPNDKSQKGLELEKIYFLKEAVGKGLGSKTMDFVKAFAKEKQQSLIWLDVIKSKPNAIRFYKRMGFSKTSDIPFSTDILDIGMWVMVLSI